MSVVMSYEQAQKFVEPFGRFAQPVPLMVLSPLITAAKYAQPPHPKWFFNLSNAAHSFCFAVYQLLGMVDMANTTMEGYTKLS